jgi:hypothetical protein
MEEIRKIREN